MRRRTLGRRQEQIRAEWAVRTKKTNLHNRREGSSGVEEIACSGGHVAFREEFQVNMSLTEETSSIHEVQRLLKQQLGFEVILLDVNTSSTDEVSSLSTVHLELFSNFAGRRHVHHTSDFFHVTRHHLGDGEGRHRSF